jgi:tRNA pseudouridine38-40 synthase
MRTIKATLAYDGSNYNGWQWQENGVSIQAVLEEALLRITSEQQRFTASGRTDAGVHAFAQVVGFRTNCSISDAALLRALNSELPFDVRVLELETVPDWFDPISDAISKRYRYVVQYGRIREVFRRNYCWFVPRLLDVPAMEQAAQQMIGCHDFQSFQTTGSARISTIRTVEAIDIHRISQPPYEWLHIEVQADGFLYNMVRNIAGTLVDVGKQKRAANSITEVLAAKDRRKAGPTAPAQGLYLLWVKYPSLETKPTKVKRRHLPANLHSPIAESPLVQLHSDEPQTSQADDS